MSIKLNNVTKKFDGKPIYENFNVEFEENKTTAILGRSGVGKTTLLSIIAGFTSFSGEVENSNKQISYIFQDIRLVPFMTVKENLHYILASIYNDKAKRERIILEILNQVGLEGFENRKVESLSGGEKQRVAIARAFIYPSSLLLIDEPFSSLDMGVKYKLVKLLLELIKKENKTVIMVTHDIDEALLLADNIIVLGENQIKKQFNINIDKQNRNVALKELVEIRKEIIDILIN